LSPALLHALSVARLGLAVLDMEAKERARVAEPGNPFGLPAGTAIRRTLKRFLRRQLSKIMGGLSREPLAAIPAVLDVTNWDDEMTSAMTPVIRPMWDKAGKRLYGELRLDPKSWEVVSPELVPQIEEQAFHFVASTNAATTLKLQAAHAELREALAGGLVDRGETLKQLTERVRGIYTGLSKSHANMIAATEASRAVHLAQEAAARESGVVVGWRWLLSGDACELCHRIANEVKAIPLGQPFAVIGDHEYYSEVRMPPAHPRCQCTAIAILSPEYGGPENVEWAETLQQPQEGLDE
jgi:hypothetical protein